MLEQLGEHRRYDSILFKQIIDEDYKMKTLSKKFLVSFALTAGILLPISNQASAAELSNAFGTTCNGVGTWHFVNNQTDGAKKGTLDAYFSNGSHSVDSYKVLSKVQHFKVTTYGNATLEDAETNLPGRLVLSDYKCIPEKKEEPPKCDPKFDPKCEL